MKDGITDRTSFAQHSRRRFLQRTGVAALVTAPAVAALISTTGTANAASPTGSAEGVMNFGDEFLADYGRLVDEIDGWCGSTGDPIIQLVRFHALKSYFDEYCGTWPKRPPWPWPPRFERISYLLDGFDKMIDVVDDWCGNSVVRFMPSELGIGIFSDDLDDWCGTRPPRWPRPRGFVFEIGY